jgi:hypothetical protein
VAPLGGGRWDARRNHDAADGGHDLVPGLGQVMTSPPHHVVASSSYRAMASSHLTAPHPVPGLGQPDDQGPNEFRRAAAGAPRSPAPRA